MANPHRVSSHTLGNYFISGVNYIKSVTMLQHYETALHQEVNKRLPLQKYSSHKNKIKSNERHQLYAYVTRVRNIIVQERFLMWELKRAYK